MNRLDINRPIRAAVLEEAAGWLVEFRSGDPAAGERRQFDDWLRASPEHVQAYLSLLPAWENAAFDTIAGEPGADTLIQWARGTEDNVVTLGARVPGPPGRSRPQWKARSIAVAASVTIAVGIAGYFAYNSWLNPTYATDVGEQTFMTLPDGTTVNLNSRSRLKVRFTAQQRSIDLLEGQALFNVRKDAARPFIVTSGDVAVRAVGTQFDVYRKPGETIVTVVEGRVAIRPPPPSAIPTAGLAAPLPAEKAEILLSAGQQFTVAPVASPQPTRVDTRIATAWTQRRLIFSAAPLAEVAAEFNRYTTRRLIVDGPDLKDFRINGVFSTADPAALVGFLRDQPGIAIVEGDTEIRISRQ